MRTELSIRLVASSSDSATSHRSRSSASSWSTCGGGAAGTRSLGSATSREGVGADSDAAPAAAAASGRCEPLGSSAGELTGGSHRAPIADGAPSPYRGRTQPSLYDAAAAPG